MRPNFNKLTEIFGQGSNVDWFGSQNNELVI